MLLRFLNLSPPCAIRAARASSRGFVSAVIAGAAGIELDTALAAPLDFAASGDWPKAVADPIRSRISVGANLMAGFLPRNYDSRNGNLFPIRPRRGEGSEIKSQVQIYPAITCIRTTAATAKSERAAEA